MRAIYEAVAGFPFGVRAQAAGRWLCSGCGAHKPSEGQFVAIQVGL